jgi:Arc/MetJ family transcription regulator
MSTRKTSVEIDEELLAQAQATLKTATVRATVEGALLEVVRARARREEIEALSAMTGMDLADPAVMAGAWRR